MGPCGTDKPARKTFRLCGPPARWNSVPPHWAGERRAPRPDRQGALPTGEAAESLLAEYTPLGDDGKFEAAMEPGGAAVVRMSRNFQLRVVNATGKQTLTPVIVSSGMRQRGRTAFNPASRSDSRPIAKYCAGTNKPSHGPRPSSQVSGCHQARSGRAHISWREARVGRRCDRMVERETGIEPVTFSLGS